MLERVEITSEAYFVCVSHALTTEQEEVMGLLLGNIDSDGRTARIWAVSLLSRSDKRKDRVEISPEQLSSATQLAEALTKDCGRYTRVVGWYHSHPHITVHPSHVDLNTQKMYQGMDSGFVGLIFSCFSKDAKLGRMQVVAFQAVDKANGAAAAQAVAESQGMRDVHTVGLEEVDIPLVVTETDNPKVQALSQLMEMQDVLRREEEQAYEASIATVHGPLVGIHSAAVYDKALCRLLEYSALPLLSAMKQRLDQNLSMIAQLEGKTPSKKV